MPPLTQEQWNKFLQTFLSQLNSTYGQERIGRFSKLPYFFENWLTSECVNAAFATFNEPEIFVNESFQKIQKVDLGLNIAGNLCALELKHIPTLSREAKYRFLGPKKSNAVNDFLDLYKSESRNHVLCKLLILYGPAQLEHDPRSSCPRGGLNKTCLRCAMKSFIQNTAVQNVQWRHHQLQVDLMYVVEVDV